MQNRNKMKIKENVAKYNQTLQLIKIGICDNIQIRNRNKSVINKFTI